MSVKKIHLFPSEESYMANSDSIDADDLALVPLNLAHVTKTGSFNSLSDKPKAYITETWRSEAQWYRRWSDGWLEQGGRLKLGAWTGGDNTDRTFSLPAAFSNTTYTCNVITGEGGFGRATLKIIRQTTSSVTVSGTGASNDDYVSYVHFYCSGY